MNMYPNVDIDKKSWPLQSLLFGHRIQPSQTKYEYLIEFLQVAIAEKQSGSKNDPTFSAMFPVEEAPDGNFRYQKTIIISRNQLFTPISQNHFLISILIH